VRVAPGENRNTGCSDRDEAKKAKKGELSSSPFCIHGVLNLLPIFRLGWRGMRVRGLLMAVMLAGVAIDVVFMTVMRSRLRIRG
jgi:hypothetical protein